MITQIGKRTGLAVLTVLLSLSAVLPAAAASRTGKGDGSGKWNFVQASETGSTEQAAAAAGEGSTQPAGIAADSGAGPGGQTVYEFDGKRYVIDYDWGTHYLTGFSPNADGSRNTRSGVDARQGYTVSSTLANLGKVILIQAESGPGNFHRYDGLYRCEDTGGPAVETGQPNTGNVPVVDLFFDTAEGAADVSANGWIAARIYILREVE